MSLPWWVWVLGLVVGAVGLVVFAARSFRKRIREEFLRFLREQRPAWQVAVGKRGEIEVRRSPEEEAGTLFPEKLYAMAAEIRENVETARRPVYERFLRMLEEAGQGALDPERDRGRVLPRIVTSEQLRELRRGLGEVPAAPLGIEGLEVVAVLDSPESVRYLGACALGELGLELAEALELGKANLRATFAGEVVRRAVERSDLNVVKSLDSHDATRLLLVPEHLQAGESVIAMIPDRDTLVLLPPPAAGDGSSLRKLARNADGPPLWREPIRVTPEGFAPAP